MFLAFQSHQSLSISTPNSSRHKPIAIMPRLRPSPISSSPKTLPATRRPYPCTVTASHINTSPTTTTTTVTTTATASRRSMLKWAAATTLLTVLSSSAPLVALAAESKSDPVFELPPLPYGYKALEPHISSVIMRYHHDTHFAGYTKNLNSVVSDILADINTASKLFPPSPIKITDDESLKAALQPANMAVLPVQFKDRLRNNGGGYLNHKQFFYIMSGQPTELFPKSPLGMAINKEYGSFDSFKTDFLGTAASLFGSGFTWLVMDDGGQLSIVKTPNQDNPVMMGLTPILPCDCWEHAWYSQYGPAKKDYFEQWWQTIDWKKVNKIYVSAKKA